MPFLWLDIDDDPGPNSHRGFIERNSIALLSNFHRAPMDAPSPGWLGHFSDRPLVRGSGLWNQRHVEDHQDDGFLDAFEKMVERAGTGPTRPNATGSQIIICFSTAIGRRRGLVMPSTN
jgi:hypothetical protein